MPSGKTHDILSIIFLPLIILGGIYIGITGNYLVILITSFMFSSFMFNGDLDTISKPYNRWLMFKFIWKPYQKIFPHRSVYTHGYIIGTIIRILYLCMIFTPLIIIYWNNVLNIIQTYEFLMCLIGLELGAILHSTLDYIT